MAKRVKGESAQGNLALIFVIIAIVALFVVNVVIRKMIDGDNIPVSQVKNVHSPMTAKEEFNLPTVVPNSSQADLPVSVLTAEKERPQAAPPEPQKEIIHEPSIKENILLQ